ncbi:MAG: uroporphyrinogen decarboxylase family protein [Candidatus Sumerlaeota bacterium]
MPLATETMTPRERWLAAISFEEMDHLPFWPKLGGAYRSSQKGKFEDWSMDQLVDYIGCEPQGGCSPCVSNINQKGAYEQTGGWSEGFIKKEFTAPSGRVMTGIDTFDAGSGSFHPTEFPIKDREDILAMTDFYNDIEVAVNKEQREELDERFKKEPPRFIVSASVGESPLMFTVEHMAGVEQAHMFLMMYPEETEALFDAMHRVLCDRCRKMVECELPADIIYFVENTSTTLISPDQYSKYCLPQIQEYGQILNSGGQRLALHMCGKLKLLLPQLAQTSAYVFEAFTSPTIGDCTLADGREGCPEICLVGGTNAALWTRPAKEIIAQLEQDLDALPHHRGIVTSSGGMMPPMADPDTVREVCEWIHNYPAKF